MAVRTTLIEDGGRLTVVDAGAPKYRPPAEPFRGDVRTSRDPCGKEPRWRP
jgi:hypothetical protein